MSVPTAITWKNADTVFDGSHARHHQKTNFTPLVDELLVELRVRGLSLADITEVLNRCLPEKFARSSVHRALVRLKINRPPKVPKIPHGEFEQSAPSFPRSRVGTRKKDAGYRIKCGMWGCAGWVNLG